MWMHFIYRKAHKGPGTVLLPTFAKLRSRDRVGPAKKIRVSRRYRDFLGEAAGPSWTHYVPERTCSTSHYHL